MKKFCFLQRGGRIDFPLVKSPPIAKTSYLDIEPGSFRKVEGKRRGARARERTEDYFTGSVLSIPSEDIQGQEVKPGRYRINGVIGYGGNFMYVMRSLEGVSARLNSTRELLTGSIIRVY